MVFILNLCLDASLGRSVRGAVPIASGLLDFRAEMSWLERKAANAGCICEASCCGVANREAGVAVERLTAIVEVMTALASVIVLLVVTVALSSWTVVEDDGVGSSSSSDSRAETCIDAMPFLACSSTDPSPKPSNDLLRGRVCDPKEFVTSVFMGVMASPPKGFAPNDFFRGTSAKLVPSSVVVGGSVLMGVMALSPPPNEGRLTPSEEDADGLRIRVTEDCSPVAEAESRADITIVSPADAEGRRDVAGVNTFPVAGVEGPT